MTAMAFEVKLEKFDGPLHILLELISKEELPITEVSLASVTDAYLNYINSQDVPTTELADFLVVATKLLLIKSQAILPVEIEPEEDPSTLATQLRLYKEFTDASEHVKRLFESVDESFGRVHADVVKSEFVEIPEGLTTMSLRESFLFLLRRLEPFFKLQQAAIERVVSVEERLNEIRDAVLSRATITFQQFASAGKSKVDIVVSFLALLELVKQRVVKTVQSGAFRDIEIKRVD